MPARHGTVAHLTDAAPRLWLRRFPNISDDPGAVTTRVVMIPHAGTGASTFARWAPLFPPEVEVLRVQLPGREDSRHAAPATSVLAAAMTLTGQLLAIRPLPTTVYGHSMGAVIAFELTRALVAAGSSPLHLCVSGRRAPHLPATREPLHLCDDAELLAGLAELSDTWHLLARAPEFLRDALDLVRQDLTMVEDYRYRGGPMVAAGGTERLPVPLTVCHGDDDPLVDRDEAQAWSLHTARAFIMRSLSGDHFFHQQHRERLVELLTGGPGSGSDMRVEK